MSESTLTHTEIITMTMISATNFTKQTNLPYFIGTEMQMKIEYF